MSGKKAVSKILDNPKFFFSYAKKFAKQKSNVGPLLSNDQLTCDPLEKANILPEQYKSVFSDPSNTVILEDISFSPEYIEEAIDEIDKDSSTSDDDIPAIVLKECKSVIPISSFPDLEKNLCGRNYSC